MVHDLFTIWFMNHDPVTIPVYYFFIVFILFDQMLIAQISAFLGQIIDKVSDDFIVFKLAWKTS
jgi:hypothetical protein